MHDPNELHLISSKEILEKTGISRATLNNYIKIGIIPRPLVKKPGKGLKNVKSLGYFPVTVLDRIEEVKRLKREGSSMTAIADILGDIGGESTENVTVKQGPYREEVPGLKTGSQIEEKFEKELQLILEDPTLPGYLLNFDFEVVWINKRAEEKILNQRINDLDNGDDRNIFRLLFKWEFQGEVKNWKEIIGFHMSFTKLKFSRTWLGRLYRGISGREVRLLERIYDDIKELPDQIVQNKHLKILRKDGSFEDYFVYSIFFREGILFLYRKAGD